MKADDVIAAPAPAAPVETRSKRAKTYAIGAAVLVVVALGAWGIGRLQGMGPASEAREQARVASEDLVRERTSVLKLEARRRLHLALLAIEERNFGIAEQELSAAAELLKQSAGDNAELGKLASEIAAQRVPASQDLAAPRSQVLGFARRLDQLLPSRIKAP